MTHGEQRALRQRLDRLDAKLDRIVSAVTQQRALCGAARSRLEAACTAVYGNGRPGLLTRMDRLETARRMWSNVASAGVGLVSGAAAMAATWLLGR